MTAATRRIMTYKLHINYNDWMCGMLNKFLSTKVRKETVNIKLLKRCRTAESEVDPGTGRKDFFNKLIKI